MKRNLFMSTAKRVPRMTEKAKAAAGISDDEVMVTSKRKVDNAIAVTSLTKKAKQTQVACSPHEISDSSAPDIQSMAKNSPGPAKVTASTRPPAPTRPTAAAVEPCVETAEEELG